mgnify:CR=1 FL=1
MSQFTAPAGILGRPDFSGDDYTLQAFQNLSNTLGQLATSNAKREVEQAYEYGLMVEQLGAEEAKNASEFGKLVDQGKVSNLANSWIEVGGQVGRAKKDFISWSTMAEENMNLSLDSDQFGLRNGDNSEDAYSSWKASVLADQRQQMNGAGYYYGKTFGGLLDKWESEFKPKFLQTRAALQRDDLRRGVADQIGDLVIKKADDLPGLMSDLTMLVSNAGNRGALGNEGYRKYTYDVLEALASNPDTAAAANYALENMREESGLQWKDHYSENLTASKRQRDAALMPRLTRDAIDNVFAVLRDNQFNGTTVDFSRVVADMDPSLSPEARQEALGNALLQSAKGFAAADNPEGMEVLLDRFEDTESPSGEPYSLVMGTEIASIRNFLKRGEEDADRKKLQKLQLDQSMAEIKLKGALGYVVTQLQTEAEQTGGAIDISEAQLRQLTEDRLRESGEDRFFIENDTYSNIANNFFTSSLGTFAATSRGIGEDQRETGAEVLQQIIRDNPTDVSAAIRQLQTAGTGLRADTLQTIRARLDGYYEAMSQTRQSSQATHNRNLMTALQGKFGFKDLSEGKIGLGDLKSQSQINAANDFLDQLDTQYSESLSAKIDGYQTMNPDEPITADIMATFAAEASKEVIEAATADGAFTYESPQSMIERIKAAGLERDFDTRGLPARGAEVGGSFFGDNLQKNIGDLRTAIQNQDASTAASELALIRPQADSLINTVESGIQLTGQNLSAYPISRLFTQQRPVSIEELERGTFDTEQGPDDISLTGFNYDPTVQPMFDGMADLESAIKEYNDVLKAAGNVNTTRVVRLVNTINKRAAASDDITGVRSLEAFLSFQKDLFEFRGYN